MKLALDELMASGALPRIELPAIEIIDTKSPEHGDYACNIAMTASKLFGKNPREIGDLIASKLDGAEVAGPGFLNLRVPTSLLVEQAAAQIQRINHPLPNPNAKRINIEFVSVNPNGPITIGSGRGAAFGSTLCNVLEAAGHTVHREYYINDGVSSEQMRLFGESVKAICNGQPVPDNGYKGDYVHEVAGRLRSAPNFETATTEFGQRYMDSLEAIYDAVVVGSFASLPSKVFKEASEAYMLRKQAEDLNAFGIRFDTWFSEQSLHDSGKVTLDMQSLVEKGVADDQPYRTTLKLAKGGVITEVLREEQAVDEDDAEGQEPTLWLRSTRFGDDMDRVLRRRDGRPTYVASDLSYHADKLTRPENADQMITVLGPDHHGYIGRLTAVVASYFLGGQGGEAIASSAPSPQPSPPEGGEGAIDAQLYDSPENKAACQAALATARGKLQVVIFQIVRFMKDGKPAPMRKRDGNIYALIDLINEIGQAALPDAPIEKQQELGRDVARFFYLMRSHETAMDFDLDLAAKQSDENPVFYVQYAHARICSIIAKAQEQGFKATDLAAFADKLTHEREHALLKRILDLPYEIERAATDHGVHRLATYATELARAFHYFYDGCRVIQVEEPDLTQARLALCEATKLTLARVFTLLGISAPESM